MESLPQTTNYSGTWTEKDKDRLAVAFNFLHKNLKTYNKPLELESRIQGFKFVLEDECPMDSVLEALRLYMKVNQDFPTPSDVYNIIYPAPVKISYSEYMDAVKSKEREISSGYVNSNAGYNEVIQAYFEQERGEKEIISPRKDILALAESAVKRIK